MTKKQQTIAACIRRVGNTVRLVRPDGSERQTTAIIQRAWMRMKLHFEEKAGKSGRLSPLYYYYIGPASVNILEEAEDAVVCCAGDTFCFTQKEAVTVGNTVMYYRGMLRQFKEEPDVFDN